MGGHGEETGRLPSTGMCGGAVGRKPGPCCWIALLGMQSLLPDGPRVV